MKKIFVIIGLLAVCSMAQTMTDPRDGKTYKTVKIGDQVWMAENLNYETSGSKCYDNKESNCEKYGRLYTWKGAMNACPSGWHLPSAEEMMTFIETVKVRVDQIVTQKKLDAVPLRNGEGEWYNHLRDANWNKGFDSFGFSVFPAGSYDSNDDYEYELGDRAYFWTSTEYGDYVYRLYISGSYADVDSDKKRLGSSVRCLQDSNEGDEASSLRSEAQPLGGTLKDSRDGKTYKTVKIGDQVWMAENLNYKISESKCYDNKESNCKKYGRLYTWESAKKACPAGWHLPSGKEIKSLVVAVGSSNYERSQNLRADSWENGSDMFGFSALPAGYYGVRKKFNNLGKNALFWSSTEVDSSIADHLFVNDSFADVLVSNKADGLSVRCLQD